MLSFSKNEAEVVVPQLALRDLLSYRAEEVHNAAMFVRECLEVRCCGRCGSLDMLEANL